MKTSTISIMGRRGDARPKSSRPWRPRRAIVLPFARPDPPAPSPRWSHLRAFCIDGRHYQLYCDNWDDADAAQCPYPATPDPRIPGTVSSNWIMDLHTGEVYVEMTKAEVEAVVAEISKADGGES